MFHRLIKAIKRSMVGQQEYSCRLTSQYRMHDDIIRFLNGYFYKKTIVTNLAVINKRMKGYELKPYVMMTLPEDGTTFLLQLLKNLRNRMFTIGVIVSSRKEAQRLDEKIQ